MTDPNIVCEHCHRVTGVKGTAIGQTLEQVEHLQRELASVRSTLAEIPEVVVCIAEARARITLPDLWEWGGDLWSLDPTPMSMSSDHVRCWAKHKRSIYPADGGWVVLGFGNEREKFDSAEEAVDYIVAKWDEEYAAWIAVVRKEASAR